MPSGGELGVSVAVLAFALAVFGIAVVGICTEDDERPASVMDIARLTVVERKRFVRDEIDAANDRHRHG